MSWWNRRRKMAADRDPEMDKIEAGMASEVERAAVYGEGLAAGVRLSLDLLIGKNSGVVPPAVFEENRWKGPIGEGLLTWAEEARSRVLRDTGYGDVERSRALGARCARCNTYNRIIVLNREIEMGGWLSRSEMNQLQRGWCCGECGEDLGARPSIPVPEDAPFARERAGG